MDDRIVFTNPDGSCGILIPSKNSGLTIDEIMAKDVPAGATNVRKITTAELPADRLFRNAWDDSNPEEFIGLDLTKAKGIAHEMRRAKRQEEMSPLDEESKNARTTSQRAQEIVSEKTAILDKYDVIQANIDAAIDEAELRSELTNQGII